jgi:hypothetical protein
MLLIGSIPDLLNVGVVGLLVVLLGLAIVSYLELKEDWI